MDGNDIWVQTEFNGINCGDKRLNKRFIKVAQSMMASPDNNIHQAMGTWTDSKAAFRLFDNSKVEYTEIYKPHIQSTLERIEQLDQNEVILSIQDSTTLNYTHHKNKKGINKLFRTPGFSTDVKGFHLHNTLLITEGGLPLGLLNQEIWHNDAPKVNRKRRPITEKASYRWLKGLQATQGLSASNKVITVCDRESDIYEFFIEATKLNKYFLIRAQQDRKLSTNGLTIKRYMENIKISGTLALNIPGNGLRKERIANLEVRHSKVALKAVQRLPEAKLDSIKDIELNVIMVQEKNPPNGIKPLYWFLLTNYPVTDFTSAIRCCKWYTLRWKIEEYHKVLKSGCKIEDCQLQTFERLTRYIALMSVIAFRLMWITMIGRNAPHESCECALRPEEWKALYCAVNKTSAFPKTPPNIKEAIKMLGCLGGFLGRKNDGDPGIVVIWRGWNKLQELAKFWSIMQMGQASCG